MPYARKDLLTWQKGMYYHIYNRGVSKVTIFREETNFLFTIGKIKEYSQAYNIIQVNLNWFTFDCVVLSEAKHLYD